MLSKAHNMKPEKAMKISPDINNSAAPKKMLER